MQFFFSIYNCSRIAQNFRNANFHCERSIPHRDAVKFKLRQDAEREECLRLTLFAGVSL